MLMSSGSLDDEEGEENLFGKVDADEKMMKFCKTWATVRGKIVK
jgi:hypothetical protein